MTAPAPLTAFDLFVWFGVITAAIAAWLVLVAVVERLLKRGRP